MISQKPYLIKAIYEWCEDNNFTAHLLTAIDTNTQIPSEYASEEEIIFNISRRATQDLTIGKDWITFKASFEGRVEEISIPIYNIKGIFSKENEQGLEFEVDLEEAKRISALKKGKLSLIK